MTTTTAPTPFGAAVTDTTADSPVVQWVIPLEVADVVLAALTREARQKNRSGEALPEAVAAAVEALREAVVTGYDHLIADVLGEEFDAPFADAIEEADALTAATEGIESTTVEPRVGRMTRRGPARKGVVTEHRPTGPGRRGRTIRKASSPASRKSGDCTSSETGGPARGRLSA